MTIAEAITRNTNIANEKWAKDELKDADAVQLGIEALKKIDYLHVTKVLGEDELLPGETKD